MPERRTRRRSRLIPAAAVQRTTDARPIALSDADAVVVTDRDGTVGSWNGPALALLDIPAERLVGRTLAATDAGLLGRIGEAVGIADSGSDGVLDWVLDAHDSPQRSIEVRATVLHGAPTLRIRFSSAWPT